MMETLVEIILRISGLIEESQCKVGCRSWGGGIEEEVEPESPRITLYIPVLTARQHQLCQAATSHAGQALSYHSYPT